MRRADLRPTPLLAEAAIPSGLKFVAGIIGGAAPPES